MKSPFEKYLYRKFQAILDDKREVTEMESLVGVLTASKRNTWAQIRDSYFSSGANKTTLSTIESAAFILVLEDDTYNATSEVKIMIMQISSLDNSHNEKRGSVKRRPMAMGGLDHPRLNTTQSNPM